MKFIFFSRRHFEDWDWRNSVEGGIGGSETSHVEMAWRLARRGHEVLSYAPIPSDCPGEWRGTFWKRFEEADFEQDGLWIIYRDPEILDKFGRRRPEQPRWLMCQDTWYREMTEERAEKLDRVLALCPEHQRYLAGAHPYLAAKLWLTSNGVKADLIRQILSGPPIERNPKKLVYASSPDRGLRALLAAFGRAREIVPDLELHVFYGFNNLDKLVASHADAPWAQSMKREAEVVRALLEAPSVTFGGRISQSDLYREWLSAGIWCYPTDFTETSCITCMEAQALGAVPITRPLWALAANVGHGILIDGSPAMDRLVVARYAGEIVRLATQPTLQQKIRESMMRWAQETYNWERWVDQWECDAAGLPPVVAQFAFQIKHSVGRTLNVGCDVDLVGFGQRPGWVNLDVRAESPILKKPNAAHILHDAREPFPSCLGAFDTVVLGDILEHLTPEDGVRALRNAAAVLRPTGRVVVTVPDDGNREALDQHIAAHGDETYAPGVRAFHHRAISRTDVETQLEAAGLRVAVYQPLDYTFCEGHGLVAEVAE